MPLKVYIADGATLDQVTALRLQALGAVNGLAVYVPPAYTREPEFDAIDPNAQANLHSADVVLGVVTTYLSKSSRHELGMAKEIGKRTIVLAAPEFAPELHAYFPGSVVAINPLDPAQSEYDMVAFLKDMELEESNKRTLIALGSMALGLLLFAPQD